MLETLASIAIIALVIVGPLSVLSSSSAYARQTKDVIVATYLAEQAIELLQNQYESLYLLCQKNPDNALCTPSSSLETTTGQTAWRVFKERFNNGGGSNSCFVSKNPHGCTFNPEDLLGDVTTSLSPSIHSANSESCPFLVRINKRIYVSGSELRDEALVPTTRSSYVCSGSVSPSDDVDTSKEFSRVITLEHLPTFNFESSLDINEQYYDDLRVTSTVTFRGVNGRVQTVEVVRFMHARL